MIRTSWGRPSTNALSGVVEGAIEFRGDHDPSWTPLPADIIGERLVSRVDSNDLERGVRYEFRARVTDAAGNEAVSGRRENGTAMAAVGPFRRPASISGLQIKGKKRAKIGFGRRPRVAGRLTDSAGRPDRGVTVS